MPSDYRLDTPPPDSRLPRHLSSDPHDPGRRNMQSRRDASDVSVQALDLADFASTLHKRPESRYLRFNPNDPYPPSPRSSPPFSAESVQPPSLARGGGAVLASSSRSPLQRPYSLPPSSIPRTFSPGYPPKTFSDKGHNYPSYLQSDQGTEVDMGNFPAFSRHWYKDRKTTQSPQNSYTSVPNDDPFDPSFPAHKYNSLDKAPYSEPGYQPITAVDSQGRDTFQWTSPAKDHASYLDSEVREERMRMLEKEFSGIGKSGPDDDSIIGSADRHGRLVTEGPQKRLAVRCLQAITALGAAVSIIYAALVMKPTTTPPPQGHLPIYILYGLSLITFFGTVYMFLIYPYCCLGRRNKESNLTGSGLNGMMVLPIQQLPGGNKHKGAKKGKKGKKGDADVQVNLIVDPTMFGKESVNFGKEDTEGSSIDRLEYGPRIPKRRGVFAGLALEARWKTARKYLKLCMVVDVICFLLWIVEFFLILFGPRCSPGGCQGWCDAYNLSTAFVCFTFILYGVSISFDIKDLHASRVSPRTRT